MPCLNAPPHARETYSCGGWIAQVTQNARETRRITSGLATGGAVSQGGGGVRCEDVGHRIYDDEYRLPTGGMFRKRDVRKAPMSP